MEIKFRDLKLITFMFSILIIFPIIICQNFSFTSDVTSQVANNCRDSVQEKKVKQFSDCNSYSNLSNFQVCCYITGVNADKTHYDGCIAVNSTLFLNKTITYSSSGISGSLICTDDYTSHNYINISINMILFMLILFYL